MDMLARVLVFTVAAILVAVGCGCCLWMLEDSCNRYYPSPEPILGVLAGVGMLLLCGGLGAVMIWAAVAK